MRWIVFGILLGTCYFPTPSFATDSTFYQYVNPYIGTGGHGHTYPGVSMPFGMMQLSPDTRLDGWDGCGGYHYSDDVIYGFSHTHLSGTGVSDYGDLLLMPFTGTDKWENGAEIGHQQGYASKFSHSLESARAGYYSVELEDYGITAELTTTDRCGYHRYTFPEGESRKLILDLEHRDKLLSSDLIFMNDSTVVGKRVSSAWATEQHFYFTVKFSEPPIRQEFKKSPGNPKSTKLIVEFDTTSTVLEVRVGISAVDINGARNNLKTEMTGKDFDFYRKQNQSAWDKELGKIRIETDDPDRKRVFYTALYHSFLNPNLFSDADGRYRGMDMKVHESDDHMQYTIFSLWDTFRATHPLFTITQQKRTVDFIRTLLKQFRHGGILPIWELSANYTGCMIGYHSIPVIVDAYVKGIRDFDLRLALRAMRHSADQDHLGLHDYKRQGFISSENESESVSKTLEYAYDDWCIAVMADSMGRTEMAERFYERSLFYKNLYNAKSKFMEPRFNGGWKSTFKPAEVTFDYTEANSWQYSMFAPHDVEGLTELLGGKDELEAWLDRLFTTSSATTGRDQPDITGLIGQYAHGNEPSHHMAYLYNFTNNPYKTQDYVHQILTTLYSNAPDGLSGNEDCGQMSAWYVLSSMGFYSLTPGSPIYVLGAPLFESAELHLENGNTFSIRATNISKHNYYVKEVLLNGQTLDRNYIYHQEIMDGGELEFVMSLTSTNYSTNAPRSVVPDTTFLPIPYVTDSDPTFVKKKIVRLSNSSGATMHYTLDGTQPTTKSPVYNKAIKIKESTDIKVIAVHAGRQSYTMNSTFRKSNNRWKIKLGSEYQNQYSGGGDRALIDQIYGSTDFRTGSWQGYFGTDVDVVVDFRKKINLKSVYLNCLQDARSWIWLPEEVEFLVSNNGKNWQIVNKTKHDVPLDQYGSIVKKLGFEKKITTRYIRVKAKNHGTCPEWHPGAGNPTHIFIDELIIEQEK